MQSTQPAAPADLTATGSPTAAASGTGTPADGAEINAEPERPPLVITLRNAVPPRDFPA